MDKAAARIAYILRNAKAQKAIAESTGNYQRAYRIMCIAIDEANDFMQAAIRYANKKKGKTNDRN